MCSARNYNSRVYWHRLRHPHHPLHRRLLPPLHRKIWPQSVHTTCTTDPLVALRYVRSLRHDRRSLPAALVDRVYLPLRLLPFSFFQHLRMIATIYANVHYIRPIVLESMLKQTINQTNRQIFDHNFLANILLLQPQFIVGSSENVASTMPLFRNKTKYEWNNFHVYKMIVMTCE